jgi:hypothetical protein
MKEEKMTDREKIARLEAEIARLQAIIDGCDVYYPESDPDCAHDSVENLLDMEDSNLVHEIHRTGIVETIYAARVRDKKNGASLIIKAPTREVAQAEVDAALARIAGQSK